jgi:4a-hydroxytetrahydrobiopterin dehydratase
MQHEKLVDSRCVPCQGGVEPLKADAVEAYKKQLSPDWQVIDNHHLQREYTFKNFRQALEFVTKVGALAETQGHHPDIYLSWGKVKISLWTHRIDGLHENDFILASKIDRL